MRRRLWGVRRYTNRHGLSRRRLPAGACVIERLEDCFDGRTAYAFHFDAPWTHAAIQQIAGIGQLEYFADFPRPFYRLLGADGLQLKGVEGLQQRRAVAPANALPRLCQELDKALAAGTNDQS
jgi:hypothetical protein